MVVWRFRKDTRAPVLAAIEEEARRSSWEDVWRAELRLGCGRGGIVAGGGFFFCGDSWMGDARWHEGKCCTRCRWMDNSKGCTRWLSIELVDPSPSSFASSRVDCYTSLLVGERGNPPEGK